MAMSRVASGSGRWEIPHWAARSSSTDPQNCMLKMIQVSQRIWTRAVGGIHLCQRIFPYVVKGSNSAVSPKAEHQSPHSHMFCKQCSGQLGTGEKKAITVGWQ